MRHNYMVLSFFISHEPHPRSEFMVSVGIVVVCILFICLYHHKHLYLTFNLIV